MDSITTLPSDALLDELQRALDEPGDQARRSLAEIVSRRGEPATRTLLQRALVLYALAGRASCGALLTLAEAALLADPRSVDALLRPDGVRRTIGGVFFAIDSNLLEPNRRARIAAQLAEDERRREERAARRAVAEAAAAKKAARRARRREREAAAAASGVSLTPPPKSKPHRRRSEPPMPPVIEYRIRR